MSVEMNAQQFLENFFGDGPLEGAMFNICSTDSAGSLHVEWFHNARDAGAHAQMQDRDVYFSPAVFPEEMPQGKKGGKGDVIGLSAVWVDVDFEHPDVKKKNAVPGSAEEAYDLIYNGFPWAPSLILHSGHGLQAFWIFKEPFIFEGPDDTDRDRANILAYATWRMINRAAVGKGWRIDSTYNLDRIMRVGGTYNMKDVENPKTVWCYEFNNTFYTEDELYDWIDEIPQEELDRVLGKKDGGVSETTRYDIQLDRSAEVPKEWWDWMVDVEPEFKLLFYKKKDVDKNKKGQDTTLSGYDMSLVNYMVLYEWPPQIIADTIIHFRRQNGDEGDVAKAANRPDYICRCIDTAKENQQKNSTDINFDQLQQRVARQQVQGEEPSKNEAEKLAQEAKAKLATKLQLRLEKILKYQSEPPHYELILQGGKRVPIGDAGNLVTQSNMQRKVFESINYWFARNKSDEWHRIVSTFGAIMEEVATGQETRDEDMLRLWIRDYLQEAGVWLDPDDAYADKRPFVYERHLYVFLNKLKHNISVSKTEKVSTKWLSLTLKKLGCGDEQMNFKNKKGSRSKITVYDVTQVAEDFIIAAEQN